MHHPIEGTYYSDFTPVYQAFVDNFARYGEIGASFCVWHGAVTITIDLSTK